MKLFAKDFMQQVWHEKSSFSWRGSKISADKASNYMKFFSCASCTIENAIAIHILVELSVKYRKVQEQHKQLDCTV